MKLAYPLTLYSIPILLCDLSQNRNIIQCVFILVYMITMFLAK